jgi:hypothetical protein
VKRQKKDKALFGSSIIPDSPPAFCMWPVFSRQCHLTNWRMPVFFRLLAMAGGEVSETNARRVRGRKALSAQQIIELIVEHYGVGASVYREFLKPADVDSGQD